MILTSLSIILVECKEDEQKNFEWSHNFCRLFSEVSRNCQKDRKNFNEYLKFSVKIPLEKINRHQCAKIIYIKVTKFKKNYQI